MNVNNKYNEKELDDFMNENIAKLDLEVPDELHNRITNGIDSLSRKSRISKSILVACMSLILLFVGTVRFNSDFAGYASKIEILKPLVELIRGVDSGIQNAYDNGYPMQPSFIHEEDGVIITIDKIFMDQERCRMTVTIEGEKIKEILEDNKNVGIYLDGWVPSRYSREGYSSSRKKTLQGDFQFELNKFDPFYSKSIVFDYKHNYIRLWLSIHEKTGERLMGQGELVHKFSMIEIPIDKSRILESKPFRQEETMDFDHADLHISKLTISPTKMKIDIRVQEKMGYYIRRLDNFYLKDDKGNIYKSECLGNDYHINESGYLAKVSLDFVPSIYFSDDIKELYLCGEGLEYLNPEEGSISLNVNDDYPLEVSIGEKRVTFYKPERNEDGQLVIKFDAPDRVVILSLKGDNSNIINDKIVERNDKICKIQYTLDAQERENYEFKVLLGYYRKEEKKVEVKLDMK